MAVKRTSFPPGCSSKNGIRLYSTPWIRHTDDSEDILRRKVSNYVSNSHAAFDDRPVAKKNRNACKYCNVMKFHRINCGSVVPCLPCVCACEFLEGIDQTMKFHKYPRQNFAKRVMFFLFSPKLQDPWLPSQAT